MAQLKKFNNLANSTLMADKIFVTPSAAVAVTSLYDNLSVPVLLNPNSSPTIQMLGAIDIRRRRRRLNRFLFFSYAARIRAVLLEKWKESLIFLLFLAALELLLCYVLLHNQYYTSAFHDQLEKKINIPKIADHIPNYCERVHFEGVTRRALMKPQGQVITSAASTTAMNCPLTTVGNENETERWSLYLEIAKCNNSNNNNSNSSQKSTTAVQYPTARWQTPFYNQSKGHNVSIIKLVQQSNSPERTYCLIYSARHYLGLEIASQLYAGRCFSNKFFKDQFFLTVELLSLKKSRVYFAIRSEKAFDECVGLHDIHAELSSNFVMKMCNARQDVNQLFYLKDVDYRKEFESLKKKPCQAKNKQPASQPKP